VPSCRSCTAVEVVAEPTPSQSRTVHLEYHFDRLLPDKLVQAYELLASDRCSSIAPSPPHASCQEVVNDQTGRLLRPCVLQSAKGEPHHCQPGSGVDAIRRDQRIPGPARVA